MGTVDPAREKFVDPAEKDIVADAGREPVDEGVECAERDMLDIRRTQDGRVCSIGRG